MRAPPCFDIVELGTERLIVARVPRASDIASLAVGLLGTGGDQGGGNRPCRIWLPGASSVHTFGMRYALDLAFLDRENRLLRARRAVPPGRVAFGPWRTASVVETKASAVSVWDGIEPGARLAFRPCLNAAADG